MFETHDQAEIPFHPEFRDTGERLWAYVRTRLHVPWLHVVYGITHEEDGEPVTLREMVFLSEVSQLEQLRQTPRLSLLAVDLMSPGHLNDTGCWQLEPLCEIWEGAVPETDNQLGYVYVLKDGRRYVDAAFDTPEDRLLNRRCVLKLGNE
jgi:hypothetical protein